MGFVLQFATFFSIICWLSQGMVTRSIQDEDRRINKKNSNQNYPGEGDFYFDEQRASDDNVEVGRAIHQSTWSKEDEEKHRSDESNAGNKVGDGRGLKNFLLNLLNLVRELKTDVLGMKEIASRKIAKAPDKSQENIHDSEMQNEMGENDKQKSFDSETNTENENQKQQFKSNYITDYYRKKGIKIMDDEAREEDLENASYSSSDESDDSSHKPEVKKNNRNSCINSRCTENKRKPDMYSFEAKKTIAIPIDKTKVPKEGVKKLDYTSKERNDGDLTETPLRYEQNNSKESNEKEAVKENGPRSSRTGKCTNKNFNNSLKKKNGPIEKSPSSAEHAITKKHQSKSLDKAKSEKPNQSTNFDNFPKGTSPLPDHRKKSRKNSNNIDRTDFDDKSGMLSQSTTLSYQSSKDVSSPDNTENQKQPYVSAASSRKPTNKKQQEQTTSPKPEVEQTSSEPEEQNPSKPEEELKTYSSNTEEEQQIKSETKEQKQNQKLPQSKIKFLKNIGHTTTAPQSQHGKTPIQSSTPEMNTDVNTSDSQVNISPKDSKGNEPNVVSTRSPLTFYKIHPNLNEDESEDNSNFANGLGNVNISPTNSGNTDNSPKAPSDNLSDDSTTSANNESNKSGNNKQGKYDSEIQRDSKIEHPKNTGNTSPTSSTNTISIDNSKKAPPDNLMDESGTSKKDKPLNSGAGELSKNYSENQEGGKTEQPKETDDSTATSSRNTINTENSNKAPSDNLNDKPSTSENDKPANSDSTQLNKNDPENQEDIKTEQPNAQQLNSDIERNQSLQNEDLEYLNLENNNKEEYNLLSLVKIKGLQSEQDSNRKIQNQINKASDEPQISEKYKENSVKRKDGRYEILTNPEYEYGKNSESFGVLDDMQELNQNEKEKFIFNYREDHKNDDMVPDNTETVFTNLSPSFQRAEYEEEPQEKYNTLLEYMYKHSNNPSILALRESVK